VNPATGETLEPAFDEATPAEVDRVVRAAEAAFEPYAALPSSRRAGFLRAVGEEILALGDALLARAETETALPRPRLTSERGRTVGQLGLFAEVVEEGSWVGARIDRALPERQPHPRPDLRRMLVPLGPVAVFGASNFPLAFSVAGGDTASALAAGCTVVVKAHPAHPGTSDLVGRAVLSAAARTGMPEGIFGLIQGASTEVGMALVRHPLVKAVGFTGSLRGGRALFDAAARRAEPIPVYAEMGSSNPVFVLPGALAERAEAIAKGLVASVTLGVGQFCTNPGLTVVERSPAADAFAKAVGALLKVAPVGTMVHAGIKSAYEQGLSARGALGGVAVAARAEGRGLSPATEAKAALLVTEAATYVGERTLQEELFGPATVLVRCDSRAELLSLARELEGHLTATVHGTSEDLAEYAELLRLLCRKVGRIIVNGYPTGVEVSHAMQHGGPYPATTDPRTTSVGSAAIERFARPLCFQDVPEAALPEELKAANPRGIWRLLDGRLTKDAL
jgi:NADP-dependent aldehyde dehydrogenase